MSNLKVFGIVEEDSVNAPGISLSVFLQGCWHPEGTPEMDEHGHCYGCHNPQSHPRDSGEIYTSDALYELLKKNPLQKTLVLSGGEPICQAKELVDLCKKVHEDGYPIWLYSGYTFEQLLTIPEWRDLAPYITVLVDGPFIPSLKSLRLKHRGSKNQRLLDVQKSMQKGKPIKK